MVLSERLSMSVGVGVTMLCFLTLQSELRYLKSKRDLDKVSQSILRCYSMCMVLHDIRRK